MTEEQTTPELWKKTIEGYIAEQKFLEEFFKKEAEDNALRAEITRTARQKLEDLLCKRGLK